MKELKVNKKERIEMEISSKGEKEGRKCHLKIE